MGITYEDTNINSISNSTISKNNTFEKEKEKDAESNEEIFIERNRKNLISGKPISESIKTAADSRAYSGKSSNIFENTNSNYISICHNPDKNICKIYIIFFNFFSKQFLHLH